MRPSPGAAKPNSSASASRARTSWIFAGTWARKESEEGILRSGLLGGAMMALLPMLAACAAGQASEVPAAGDQLLRLHYDSAATGLRRDYFVYLPVGYGEDAQRKWPVMLFLHGNGERGDGLEELD